MRTKKQVLEQFYRLQKKYVERPNAIVSLQVYTDEAGGYWSVRLSVSQFKGTKLVWSELLEWTHYSRHNLADEVANLALVEEFEKRMEKK